MKMNAIESQQVLEWMAIGAETKGWAKALLILLRGRFPPGATPEMEATIRATFDLDRLGSWVDLTVKANSLDDFRQAAGL